MRVVVWGQKLTKSALDNAKRIAGKSKVIGATFEKPDENLPVYLFKNESSILAFAAKDCEDVLFLPAKYKALPQFLKTVTPILGVDADLVSFDFREGYSTKKSAQSLFFCLSANGCKAIQENLNNLNGLLSHHIPEMLFCQSQ